MNKQGKLFGKISVIDILAVAAVLLVIAGVYFKFLAPSEKVVTDSQPLEYTMKFRELRMPSVEAFQKLGKVSDATTREDLGEIVAVDYAPAKVNRDLTNGKVAEMEVPEKFDVLVKIRVEGKHNNGGYYTQKDNKKLGVGSGLTVNSKFVKSYGEIVSIEEAAE